VAAERVAFIDTHLNNGMTISAPQKRGCRTFAPSERATLADLPSENILDGLVKKPYRRGMRVERRKSKDWIRRTSQMVAVLTPAKGGVNVPP
jgi:hypothetical protein